VLLLVPYHSARVFDTDDPFYVQNDQLSSPLTDWIISLGDAIGMQLLFLLAGAAAWFALRTRNNRSYLSERIQRLLTPLIFGILVLVPPQTYLGLRTHSEYAGSYVDYYPRFLEFHAEDFAGYTQGGFTPAHLWFILFLFAFSVLALPLFRWMRSPAGLRLTARTGDLASRPGALYLLAIPMIGLERLLDATAYENPVLLFFYFFWFFVAGYVLMSESRFTEAIDRGRRTALLAGPVLWIVLRLLPAGIQPDWFSWMRRSFFERGLFTWLTILCLLGYGRRLLTRPNSFLVYFGEAGYPFYILHQTVLVGIAYYVVRWEASIAVKYLVVAAATFAATTLLYELTIRRFRPSRILFGMKSRRQPTAIGHPHQAGT
jgi:peptidoglycan/LPS O-acetylase OafA/YrhL